MVICPPQRVPRPPPPRPWSCLPLRRERMTRTMAGANGGAGDAATVWSGAEDIRCRQRTAPQRACVLPIRCPCRCCLGARRQQLLQLTRQSALQRSALEGQHRSAHLLKEMSLLRLGRRSDCTTAGSVNAVTLMTGFRLSSGGDRRVHIPYAPGQRRFRGRLQNGSTEGRRRWPLCCREVPGYACTELVA